MTDTDTLAHDDGPRCTIEFPTTLWNRARRIGFDNKIPVSKFVREGLQLRLDEFEGKVKVTPVEGEPNAAN